MTLWESTRLFLQASQKHTTVTRYMTETWQQTSKSISATQNQNVNEAEVKKNNNEEIWASFRHTPLQLVIWRVTEWTKIEKEHKMLTSKPGTKLLIFLAPGRVLALTQPGGPFFPMLFIFLLFRLFIIRVVYNSFTCSLCIFGSPSLVFLYWTENDGHFFLSPKRLRALKYMQAEIQSP